ncbi:hypothetical protein HYX08_06610 [Candidatus Woesearchaeota archaeon]|nr:hypothetical protein [Candidatus Woesearchaeota archaeon]
MKKALTSIIASALLSLAPQTVMAQTESNKPPTSKTIKYEICDFNTGASLGYFGVGLLTEKGRKCFASNMKPYLSPEGSESCTVFVQDSKYANKNCPKEVFDQIH